LNYWVFVVVDHTIGRSRVMAEDVLRSRVKKKFWLLSDKSPHLKDIKEGDKVLFYVGGRKGKKFQGCATVDKAPRPLSEEQRRVMIDDYGGRHVYIVEFRDVEFWKDERRIEDYLGLLSFIKNPKNWGAYLQKGVIKIDKGDYELIKGG